MLDPQTRCSPARPQRRSIRGPPRRVLDFRLVDETAISRVVVSLPVALKAKPGNAKFRAESSLAGYP